MTTTSRLDPDAAFDRQHLAASRSYLTAFYGWSGARLDGFLAAEQDLVRFDAPKKCVKGLACGNTCIAKGRTCRTKGDPQKAARLKQLLALPAAGQSSAAAMAITMKEPARPPITDREIRRAVARYYGVKDNEAVSVRHMHSRRKFKMEEGERWTGSGSIGKTEHVGGKKDKYTMEDWKELYRKNVDYLPGEENQTGPETINGVNLRQYYKPWRVFGIDPNKRSKEDRKTNKDIKDAYKRLSKIYHPDIPKTGNREMFEAIENMYKSITVEP
jgi:hypothetical protein